MNNEQRFFALLDEVSPQISQLWNRDNRELDVQLARSAFGHLSTGQAHMLRFLWAVWSGPYSDASVEFDLVQAISELDDRHCSIIAGWVKSPFFP